MVEEIVYRKFLEWLAEDIPFWDATSELIPGNVFCEAVVLAKEDGVAACTEEIAYILKHLSLQVTLLKKSGEEFKRGEILLEIKGDMRKVLSTERLVLNILSHTCGIATATKRLVEKVKKISPCTKIAATRKTLPGLRYFEKKAVEAGGGDTHRLSLSDMILIKDNHLKYFKSVKRAVEKAKEKNSFYRKIEVEVSNLNEAIEAAEAGADIVMLDNFAPEEVAEIIKVLEEKRLRKRVLIEVSGGVTEENIIEYAKAQPDVISLGRLTHSVKAVDLSLEVTGVWK